MSNASESRNDRASSHGGAGRRPQSSRRLFYGALLATLVVMLLTVYIAFFLPGEQSPTLSAADSSATSEAYTFATAQMHRQATREAADSTSTAETMATVSARTESSATALAYANSTATSAAQATIEAPPTLTAEAMQHLEDETAAQATVEAVEPAATVVFGPAGGTLAQQSIEQATCDDSGAKLHNFIAEARLYNPSLANQGWDYAIGFTDPSADDRSRYAVVLDSQQQISLRLDAPGYSVEDRTTTFNPVDLSPEGSNLLRVYVVDGTALAYVNDKYEASFDLNGVDLGKPAPETWDVMVCTGIKENDVHHSNSTRYETFKVWSIP